MRKRGAELPSTRSSPLAPWVRGRGKGAGLEAQRLPRSKLLGRKAGGDAHKSRAPLQRAKERKMLLGKAGLQNWVLAEWRGESRASALGILILILIPFLLCHILTLPTDPLPRCAPRPGQMLLLLLSFIICFCAQAELSASPGAGY